MRYTGAFPFPPVPITVHDQTPHVPPPPYPEGEDPKRESLAPSRPPPPGNPPDLRLRCRVDGPGDRQEPGACSGFFGGSDFVWGSLIGIFLGAMSGGYWLGGWMSERWPRQVLLNALLAAAGAFTLLLPLWAAPLCRALAGGPEGWVDLGPRLGPLTAALILFALPSLLMGVASPFAVRLLARDLERVGAVAGRLYAVGTLGSIVGTLVAAFWLIPAFGVNTILTAIGAALVATTVFTLPIGRPALVILGIGAGLLALRLLIAPPVLLAQPAKGRFEIVESRDSAYSAMTVVDHLLPGPGGRMAPVARQLRFGKYVQGAVFVHPWQQRGREHWSAAPYTDLFHLTKLFAPELKRVLFVGGGVGVGPRSFRRHYPQAQIDLVEIDPVVVDSPSSISTSSPTSGCGSTSRTEEPACAEIPTSGGMRSSSTPSASVGGCPFT